MKRVISAIIVLAMVVVLPTSAIAADTEENTAAESKSIRLDSSETVVMYQIEESDGSISAIVLKGNALSHGLRMKLKESDKDGAASHSSSNANPYLITASAFVKSTLAAIKNGDNLSAAIGNITTDTAKTALKYIMVISSKELVKALLKNTGFAAFGTNPALLVFYDAVADVAIDWLFEHADPQAIVTEGAAKLGDTTVAIYEVVADNIEELNIPGKADAFYHDVTDALAEGKTVVVTYVQDATDYVGEKAGSLKTAFVTFFTSTF